MIVVNGVRYEYDASLWCDRLTRVGGCGHAFEGGGLCGFAAYIANIEEAVGKLGASDRVPGNQGLLDVGSGVDICTAITCGGFCARCGVRGSKCGCRARFDDCFSYRTTGVFCAGCSGIRVLGRADGSRRDVYLTQGGVGEGRECSGEARGDVGTSAHIPRVGSGAIGDNVAGCNGDNAGSAAGVGVTDRASVNDSESFANVGGEADKCQSAVSGVSSKTLANREKRKKAKLRKQRKQSVDLSASSRADAKQAETEPVVSPVPEWRRKDKVVDITPARYVAGLINADADDELKASVKAKWIAKNKLEAAKAEREFAVLQGVDVDVAVRRQNVIVRSAIERGLVTIEKSHASLRGADVHSSDDESRVHTMLSGSSGSISPNSSISEAELRAIIARDAELERKNVELEKRVNDLIAQMTKGGVKPKEEIPAPKSMWTVDEHGDLLQEHQDALFDSGYCFTTGDTVPQRCADGKMRTYVNYF